MAERRSLSDLGDEVDDAGQLTIGEHTVDVTEVATAALAYVAAYVDARDLRLATARIVQDQCFHDLLVVSGFGCECDEGTCPGPIRRSIRA